MNTRSQATRHHASRREHASYRATPTRTVEGFPKPSVTSFPVADGVIADSESRGESTCGVPLLAELWRSALRPRPRPPGSDAELSRLESVRRFLLD
jgi:hypothetical protein